MHINHCRPALGLISLLATGAVLWTACGAGSRDEASDGAVSASCDEIPDLQSYRYSVALSLNSASPTPPPPADSQAAPAPLSAFADALTALFSDFTLEGAYVAPDRSQAILRFRNEELELRTIA